MRVVEVFGPTIQGEGPHAGRVCHFLRFGGCDYRCSWCDTMYAVTPALVRAAEDLEPAEILARLEELAPAPMLVLSGGNPALQRLDGLFLGLRHRYPTIAVETQGSRWRPWLNETDSLVISPKPPSSGEATPMHWLYFERFMARSAGARARVLKVVVFDDEDLAWARGVHNAYPAVPLYLSAGTDQDAADIRAAVADRYAWLCERVAGDKRLHAAIVLPQLHVIAWGARVGV
jgi:7-carboxy-7-deazaguanine synthase